MIATDPDALLRAYAPIVYLHPDEASMPSSIEWLLERANLFDGTGNPKLAPAGSVSALMAAGAGPDWYLKLRDGARAGQGPGAPVYASCRAITRDGAPVAYDLTYWHNYPFNGNIFDLGKAKGVLGAAIAVGLLLPYTPFGYATVAAASAALAFLGSVDGMMMHESDWEHVCVRIDENGAILGVYYSAHAEGRWRLQRAALGSPSSNCYQLMGTRPIAYSALESHALYPMAGEIERIGGFANDYTEQGQTWDPLDSATPGNPMGRLVNIGDDIASPPEGCEWIQYPGLWGMPQAGGHIALFGEDLWEYETGKTGPAQRSQFTRGDDDAPSDWSSAPTPLPLAAGGGPLALAQYGGFLTLAYGAPGADTLRCGVWNGYAWTQPDVPGLDQLGHDSALAMAAYGGDLHAFVRVAGDLEWAELVLAEDGTTQGWAFAAFTSPLQNPPADGALAAAAYGGELILVFVRRNRFVMFGYDGTNWTDQTPLHPELRDWAVDGAVALASYAGLLHLAYASGGALRYARFSPATGWVDATPAQARAVTGDIRLIAYAGYLTLAYARGGQIFWSRTSLAGPWFTDADGNDFAVTGASAGPGGLGLAPFAAGDYLSLVYADPSGALLQTDLMGG